MSSECESFHMYSFWLIAFVFLNEINASTSLPFIPFLASIHLLSFATDPIYNFIFINIVLVILLQISIFFLNYKYATCSVPCIFLSFSASCLFRSNTGISIVRIILYVSILLFSQWLVSFVSPLIFHSLHR